MAVRILRIGQQISPPPFLRSGYGPGVPSFARRSGHGFKSRTARGFLDDVLQSRRRHFPILGAHLDGLAGPCKLI